MSTRTSIKRRFLAFSITLFLTLFIGGSAAFIIFMRQIVHSGKESDLRRMTEIERIKLESSVGAEIAIAMKMADSPLIQNYFMNPADPNLEKIAFEEIVGYRRAFKGNSVFWVNDIDHKFYSDDADPFDLDVTDPVNYWYLMTLNETEKYNFNINYNPNLNVTNLWINAPVFNSGRKPIGILGTGINLSSFIDSIYRDYSGEADLYFFNREGEITGARDTNLVADKTTIDSFLGDTGAQMLRRAKDLSPGQTHSFTVRQGEVTVAEVPALGWYIAAIIPLTLADYLNTNMTYLFLAMIIIIAVTFIIFYLFITGLIKPLNIMVTTLDQISGDWDLTRRLEIKHKDETGTLAEFFNLTFDRMSELLRGIKGKTFALTDTSDELKSTMDETANAIARIDETVQNMRGMVQNQTEEANIAAASTERINEGLDTLNGHIATQAEVVAQSSSAIEEMLASIRSVTETLEKNTENINSLAASSGAGRTDLQKVSQDIQEVARESEGLLEINSVMQNIASQTNLLSMNAAIEAAHAGESGKGFAVVADEIRKLAENSGKQSKTISAVLKKIKTSIDAITKSTGIVLERFNVMEKEVETVSNQETQIRDAMEEQKTGSRQILEAITRLNSVTDEVQRASAKIEQESEEVMHQSADLKRISGEVAEGMSGMTESAEMISSAVTRVQEISEENQSNVDDLSAEISRFKVN